MNENLTNINKPEPVECEQFRLKCLLGNTDIVLNTIIHSDCLSALSRFPDKSIDCVISSPPYYQLRDYGFDGQWGLEKTYPEYLEHLWSLMDELYRVLKDEGTCWINLGDSYSGSCGMGSQYDNKHAKGMQIIKQFEKGRALEIPNKSLMLMPHRFAIGCIERGWILRNDIKWLKPNGMPESVTDRFSKKSEYFFFFVKQQKYFFNLDGIRESHKFSSIQRQERAVSYNNKWVDGADGQTPHNLSRPRPNKKGLRTALEAMDNGQALNAKGKNPGDVSHFWQVSEDWIFPTKGSREKHFASFNTDLIDRPIVAGCPEGGIILDPFAGTGTTLARAIELDRFAIGIDGNKEYCEIANKRMQPHISQPKLWDNTSVA